MDKYSVLIIGCGNAGLRHEFDKLRVKPASLYGGAMVFKDRFKVTGICDSDEETLAEASEHLPDAKAFSNYKDAIKDLDPDVVVIATWTTSHCEIFRYALENGVRGVVLEKPVGVSAEEADGMLKLWEKYRVPVAVNHVRRWEKSYRFLKDVVADQELGPVRSVYGRVLLGAVKDEYEDEVMELEGGGTMFHDGTHLIDILLFMFRDLEFVSGTVKRGRVLDRSTHALLLGNGEVPVFVEIGGERSFFEFTVTVEGQKGSCTIGNGIAEWKGIKESRLYEGYRDSVVQPFPHHKLEKYSGGYGYAGPFYELLEAFDGRTDFCNDSFTDSVRGVRMMSQILAESRVLKDVKGDK